MTFSSYMEVNIIVDMVLIFILSLVVLPRCPRAFAVLVALNLIQYAYIVPLNLETGGKARWVWQGGAPTAHEQQFHTKVMEHSNPATNPVQLIARFPDIVNSVRTGFGENAVVDSAAGGNALGFLREPNKTADLPKDPAQSRQITLSLDRVLVDSLRDPAALWLGLRIFWLGASFLLFIQRPVIGAAAACANLLPVPFFAKLFPYWTHQANNNQALIKANQHLENPETLGEWFIAFWTSHAATVLGLSLLILVSVGGFAALRRVRQDSWLHRLEKQANPERFFVHLNGALHPFAIEGTDLVVDDVHFNLERFIPDPEDPYSWKVGPKTELKFIDRQNQTTPASRMSAGYSFKRRRA